jgi:hypothetical protein
VACADPGGASRYITWETFEANLKRLEENARAHPVRLKVPPREGPALLQGLALCGNCGRRMGIRYHWRGTDLVPDYLCQGQAIEKLEKACMSIPGANVDAAVSLLLLEAVTPVEPEVSRFQLALSGSSTPLQAIARETRVGLRGQIRAVCLARKA